MAGDAPPSRCGAEYKRLSVVLALKSRSIGIGIDDQADPASAQQLIQPHVSNVTRFLLSEIVAQLNYPTLAAPQAGHEFALMQEHES
jgi:hypothetical protein